MKAFWTWCSLPAPMPSTVVTDLPAAARAGIKQLTTGAPSTSTVHAPQTPAPHTSFVPVSLSASRTTSMRRLSGWSGRGSTRPLILIVLICDLQIFGGRIFLRWLASRAQLRRGTDGAGHQRSHQKCQITMRLGYRSLRSGGLRPERRQKHPRRAFDHLGDAPCRRRRRGLKDKRQKQRRLTGQHDLLRSELAVVDRKLLRLDMHLEIVGEPVDSALEHLLIKATADLRHPLGDRRHGADRRSTARPAQQLDIGLPEFPKRRFDVALRTEIESYFLLIGHFLFDDGFEQPVLVGEIDVQRSLGNAVGAGDLAHAGAIKSEVQEHLARAVKNLTAF